MASLINEHDDDDDKTISQNFDDVVYSQDDSVGMAIAMERYCRRMTSVCLSVCPWRWWFLITYVELRGIYYTVN